jgi:hypothetical protein
MSTTVYVARKIVTLNPKQPLATHLAVRDGRVLAVGDLDRMREWGRFELDERFADKVLLPGFVEGHCHLKEGGMWDWPYVGWFARRGPDGRVWQGGIRWTRWCSAWRASTPRCARPARATRCR